MILRPSRLISRSDRPAEPTQLVLFFPPRRDAPDPNALLMRDHQRRSIPHILQPHAPGTLVMGRSLPERVTAIGFRALPAVGCGKPDLVARRRPENSLHAISSPRTVSFLSVAVGRDHGNRTFVVASRVFMVGKGDPFAVRRNLGVADPVDAVEQHFANGILQAPMTVFGNVTDDRHRCRRWRTSRRPAHCPALRAAFRR